MEMVTLNDGNKIPAVGFGVFLIPNDGATYEAVTRALKAGYRHIDTAQAYGNERVVGGPKINTAFLEAGLLDEISLLVGAGIDGRGSMPAVFDGLAMQHDVTKLKLIDVKKFDSDAVWIRYQCQKSRRQIINNMLR